jgi:hypothetical protein
MKSKEEIEQRLKEIEERLKGMPFYEPQLDSLLGEQNALQWVLGIEE